MLYPIACLDQGTTGNFTSINQICKKKNPLYLFYQFKKLPKIIYKYSKIYWEALDRQNGKEEENPVIEHKVSDVELPKRLEN